MVEKNSDWKNELEKASKKIDGDILETFLDKKVSEFNKSQDDEHEYTKLFGCEAGERPWTIRNNLFGRANEIVNCIEKITDQELLIRIASEAKLKSIKCAAIKKIVSQDILIKYAHNKDRDIRYATLYHLRDQKALEYLALNDVDSKIREVATEFTEDQSVLYKIAMEDFSTNVQLKALSKLTDLKAIIHIADKASGEVQDLATRRKLRILSDYIKRDLTSNKSVVKWPKHITLYDTYIDFFDDSKTLLMSIPYSRYGVCSIPYRSYWWAVDCTSGGVELNQLELLAKYFNEKTKNIYKIVPQFNTSVSFRGTETEMHHYIYREVDMFRK